MLSAPYWFDPRIHQLGPLGWSGKLHAKVTPLATRVIDLVSYSGVNVRSTTISQACESCVDFGCGVGMSTPPFGVGVDTSSFMIEEAKKRDPAGTYVVGNAEVYGDESSVDAAYASFLFHEVPLSSWSRILDNMQRVSKKEVVVVDIHPSKVPSAWMLRGEPYLEDYLADFDSFFRKWADDEKCSVSYDEPVKGRVSRWKASRKKKW